MKERERVRLSIQDRLLPGATLREKYDKARRNLLAAVYARLSGDERESAAPLATFEDGLRHARFAAAALESASREKWVSIA